MRPIRDLRLGILVVLVALVLAVGAALHWYQRDSSGRSRQAFIADSTRPVPGSANQAEVHAAFQQAVALLHTKQFAGATAAWEEVLALAPKMPEAHTNLGFSLIGLDDCARARAAFERALELRPQQENAYYGLALCHERDGDLDLALGAMRVFVHLSDPESPFVRRALAAIWEWDAQVSQSKTPANEDEVFETSPGSG